MLGKVGGIETESLLRWRLGRGGRLLHRCIVRRWLRVAIVVPRLRRGGACTASVVGLLALRRRRWRIRLIVHGRSRLQLFFIARLLGLVVIDQPVGGRVVALDRLGRSQFRQDRLGKHLAQLDTVLVKGIDVPNDALSKS